MYDTLLAAMWEKIEANPDDPEGTAGRFSAMAEIITYQEETTYWRAHELGVHPGDMGITRGPLGKLGNPLLGGVPKGRDGYERRLLLRNLINREVGKGGKGALEGETPRDVKSRSQADFLPF